MPSTHQLAAILFADIEGYTALMQDDEVMANAFREKLKKNLEQFVGTHNGRILKLSGDGALCIFSSAIEAVRAAIEIQEQMLGDPRVPLRIGIHTGDVMIEGDDVHGDGVNVASRIESFAVAGGIFISDRVYADIKNQKDIKAVSLGKYGLKNVDLPVEIFAISNEGLIVPKNKLQGKGKPEPRKNSITKKYFVVAAILVIAIAGIALFKRDKLFLSAVAEAEHKSIAVLPFLNLSNSKEDEYFSDGMCDEILTQLSKIGDLKVISHTSVMQYKDTKKTISEIAEALGVNNILEGSVQKINDRIRINVQLINAKTDRHLWAESYDRDNKDVFAIQSEIAKQIAHELKATLSEREKLLIEGKPTDNLQAYDLYLRGKNYKETKFGTTEKEILEKTERMFRAAFRLDPRFVEAYSELIRMYIMIYWYGTETDHTVYKEKAKNLLDTLLSLNIDKPAVRIANGYYKYHGERDYNGAVSEFNIVEKSSPNNSDVLLAKGFVYRRLGKFEDAINNFQKATTLNPNSDESLHSLCETLVFDRKADEATEAFDKAIALAPDDAGLYISKADVFISLKNDFKTAKTILDNSKDFVDPAKLKDMYAIMDMLQGNYAPALKACAENPDFIQYDHWGVHSNAHLTAIIYRAQENTDSAKKYFTKERDLMLLLVKKSPDDFRYYVSLAIEYAGLGQKEKAFENINRARQLMPLTRDALLGVVPLEGLAVVHTYLGEQDAAIDILEQLLKLPFGGLCNNTIPLYIRYPYWKSLQNNPRFKKLIS